MSLSDTRTISIVLPHLLTVNYVTNKNKYITLFNMFLSIFVVRYKVENEAVYKVHGEQLLQANGEGGV